ncbi:spinster family MFS transporter [Schlesneria paludicola]|uniref:spinster family MFS transporter n=1 Tax=Schlesneria paludicola TaxID=360056 RepID=UPI00058DCB3F|nr:MFS transporter [Schlesneria paludicola]
MSRDHDQDEFPSPGYAWYVVGVLTVAYIISFIDRQIINLMVGPIKRDLDISDTQISLLQGLTFAVFYTLFGIPLGRLADTRSRRGIIFFGIAFWSLMTAGCGLTKRFWDLALMRMGVGIGEATLSPAAYSLIADYFPPHRRATAMSVYSMGIYLGSGVAFILGGLVVKFASTQETFAVPVIGVVRSWQLVFFIVGLPGLLVALLLLSVKEPTRKGLVGKQKSHGATISLTETWQYVRANMATFVCLNLGIAMVTMNSYASISWIPSMFLRRFGWSQGGVGLVYGTIIATSGTLGVVAGGWLSDLWTQRGCADSPLRVAWLSTLCGLPFVVLYPLAPTGNLVAALLVPMVFFGSVPFGVAPAAIQRMMPNMMRAQGTSIYLFVINLVGMGLGPTFAALLTDNVFEDPNQVHKSLLIVGTASYVLACILLGISLSNYRRSLDYLQQWTHDKAQTAEVAAT